MKNWLLENLRFLNFIRQSRVYLIKLKFSEGEAMKYWVTGHVTAYVEIEADSAEEAEKIAEKTMSLPQFFDYFEAEEIEVDEEN